VIFSHPLHPYTAGLLAAMPGLGAPKSRLRAIPGMVPNPLDWPTGCHFRDRCDRADAACAQAQPPLRELAPGHFVACVKAA
jgi:peptide/nickel transport system ATP-binding protein